MRKKDVENFPAKILSRLSGGAIRSGLAEIVSDRKRERGEMEIQQRINYNGGNLLTFFYDEGGWIYVHIDSKDGSAFSDRDGINELLKNPVKLSVDPEKRARRRNYSRFVSDGRVMEEYPSSGSEITLGFQVCSRDRDKIFDSFWMKFRPILSYLKEKSSTPR